MEMGMGIGAAEKFICQDKEWDSGGGAKRDSIFERDCFAYLSMATLTIVSYAL